MFYLEVFQVDSFQQSFSQPYHKMDLAKKFTFLYNLYRKLYHACAEKFNIFISKL